jgi:hypothetical protein
MTRVRGFWVAGAVGAVAAAVACLTVGTGGDGAGGVFGERAREERRAAELAALQDRRAREVRTVDLVASYLATDGLSLAAAVRILEGLDLGVRSELVYAYSRLFQDAPPTEREALACYVLRKALDVAAGDADPGRRVNLSARLAAEYQALFGIPPPRVAGDGRWWLDLQPR